MQSTLRVRLALCLNKHTRQHFCLHAAPYLLPLSLQISSRERRALEVRIQSPQGTSSCGAMMRDHWMWPTITREPFSALIPALLVTARCESTHVKGGWGAPSQLCTLPHCRFLCALQPKDRKAWAQRWRALIKPGGQLATLIFPVDPSRDKDQGPPFPVTPELYTELLTPEGAHIPLNTLLRTRELQGSKLVSASHAYLLIAAQSYDVACSTDPYLNLP